jgi:hypothetical protein
MVGSLAIKSAVLAVLLVGIWLTPTNAQVTLAWNPSPTPGVAGYNLCWGTNSGVYTFTNTCPSPQTNLTITNLVADQTYFFAAQSFLSNGVAGPFSNEECVTNDPAFLLPGFVEMTNISSQGNNGSGDSGIIPIVSGDGGGVTSESANCSTNLWGVPPFLAMTMSNGQPNLIICGTVGATLVIQTTTNLLSPQGWETVTNVCLTNISLAGQSDQADQAQNLLNLAFVPAAQTFPITPGPSPCPQFFRALMAYDYVILASIVLKGQGVTPRLIVVNMPNFGLDDACYVNETGSFIHYNWTNFTLQLQNSRPSIRQIANTLASSLHLNWTSASEFTYSNGLGRILATVIETEPPSSDPIPGQSPPGPPMVIDF